LVRLGATVGGRDGVAGRVGWVGTTFGDGVSFGNFGAPNRYLSLSSFNAAVAATMNCRQIGAA
jgi:hypothetical protein